MRDLEQEIGATLFERTNGGTRLTPAGQEFLEAARRIIDETEVMVARLKTRSRGESGGLTIGVPDRTPSQFANWSAWRIAGS